MPQGTQPIPFPVLQRHPLHFDELGLLAGDSPAEVVFWDDSRAWAITEYRQARAVLASRSFSTEVTTPGFPNVVPGISAVGPEQISFLRMDPPRHDHLRRMLIPHFSHRRMERLRPRVREISQTYLDELAQHGPPADVSALVAMPIPCKITCEMLGVPYADHAFFQDRAVAIATGESGEAVAAGTGELFGYLTELVQAKEAERGDDMISQLVVEQLWPGTLTRDELVAMSMLLLLAGIETSANMISLGVLSLIDRPDLVEVARAGGDGLANLVEELMRYHSIGANSVWRVAAEDVQIGDLQFRKGQAVVILLDAANRDSAAFPGGDQLCPQPPGDGPHLAFGQGVHQCLGQSLARVELQEALGGFFRRFSGVQLAVPLEEVKYRGGAVVRGMGELPLTWEQAR
jgi:pentalenic acid synthase